MLYRTQYIPHHPLFTQNRSGDHTSNNDTASNINTHQRSCVTSREYMDVETPVDARNGCRNGKCRQRPRQIANRTQVFPSPLSPRTILRPTSTHKRAIRLSKQPRAEKKKVNTKGHRREKRGNKRPCMRVGSSLTNSLRSLACNDAVPSESPPTWSPFRRWSARFGALGLRLCRSVRWHLH